MQAVVMQCRNAVRRIAAAFARMNVPMHTPFSFRTQLRLGLRIAAALLVLLVAGCATPMPRKDDPYENFNRKMYAFNDFAHRVAIRPVAVAYRKVTNPTTRTLFSNFFANIESPITIGNDLLQANIKEAGKATGRFVINSTVGVLGFFDP